MPRRVAIAAAAVVAAALTPAIAEASVVQVTPLGELRLDGQPGEANNVEIFYRTAAEAGFGGVSDRIVVADAGATAQGVSETGCVVIITGAVSCDARPIATIGIALGDGNDVFTLNSGKSDAVPASYELAVRGGEGNDVIKGGVGDDRLLGDAGNDIVAGWIGDDFLAGGAGSDGALGFTGNDLITGGSGSDALFGQKGRDSMQGQGGNDVLIARDGFRDSRIDCGPGGLEQALTDRRDPRPRSCPEEKRASTKGK